MITVPLKLTADSSQAVRSIEEERAAVQRLGQTILQLNAGTDVLARINASVGVREDFDTAARAADVAAYGSALDELRAKFNPLFAAEREHLAVLNEISRARKVGAIDVDEEVAAVARENAAYEQLTKTMTAAQSRGRTGVSSFQTSNIAAQFQDIGVSAALGFNPLQVGLAQGTQLAPVLADLKASGGLVAGLRTAFVSLVSPVSLATIALVTLGTAGIQWLLSLHGSVKTADEALKEHDEIIEQIKRSWGDAGQALDAYSKRRPVLLGAGARQDVEELQRQLQTATDTFTQKVGMSLAPDAVFHDIFNGGRLVDFLVDKEFKPFEEQILAIRKQAKDGKPDFDAFYTAVEQKVSADPGLRELADKLETASKDAEELARKLDQAGTAAQIAGGKYSAALSGFGAIEDLGKTHDLGDLQFQVSGRSQAEQAAQAHQIEMDAINAKSPAQLADIARRRMALDLDNQKITAELRAQKIEEAGAEAYAQASRSIADSSRSRLASVQQSIEAAQLDLDLIGKTVEESERLRFTRQQLASAELEAAQSGTTVSAAYRAEVEKLGVAYGKLQAAIALGKLRDDLAFDRDQLGRSSVDQQVAEQLRSIFGDDYVSHMDSAEAAQIRYNKSLGDTIDLGKELTSGFLTDIAGSLRQASGGWKNFGDVAKSALDAVTSATGNLLAKLEDKALSSLADLLIGGITSGFSGGGLPIGGTKGFIPGITGPKLFARGGVSDVPAIFGDAGPEAAVPLPDGRRIPVELRDAGSSAAPVVNVTIVKGADEDKVETSTAPDGSINITAMVKSIVNTSLASGGHDAVLAQSFGLRRKGR